MSAYFVLHIQYVGRPPEARNVTAAVTVIGREAGDLVLNDPQGSTRHAEIHFQNGRVFVRDAGSTNGTWFNNQRMTEFPLEPGQSFRCGQTWIQLISVQSGQQVGPMGTMVAMAAAPVGGYAQPAPQAQPPQQQGWGGAPQQQQPPAYAAPAAQPQQAWGGAQQASSPQQAAWGAQPQQQPAGYGGVPGAQGAYGAPAQQQGGAYAPPAQYGSPQQQAGAYGASQQAGAYGAPPQGYGAPPQQQGGAYGSPPAQQQQAGAYGAPPAQQQPGAYGGPPAGQLPAAQTAFSAAEQAGYGTPPPSFGVRSSQRGAGANPPPGGVSPPITGSAAAAGADPAGGVRTHFDAKGVDLLVKMLIGGLLSTITLGIYFPWFACDLIRFICANTAIGPTAHGRLKIEFTGKGGPLLGMMLLGMLLTIVTLGIYLPWFVCKQVKFFTDNTLLTAEDGTRYRLSFVGEGKDLLVPILVGYLLTYVTLGIYGSWFICKLYKELATRTTILENDQPAGSMDFEGKGAELFVTTLVGVLLSIITLGIYIPWFQVKIYKFFAAGTRFRYQNRVFAGEFQGTGGEYIVILLVGLLLTIVTVYIYLPWFLIKQWKFQWNNRVFKEIGGGAVGATGATGATLGDTKFSAGMGPA